MKYTQLILLDITINIYSNNYVQYKNTFMNQNIFYKYIKYYILFGILL